MKSPPLFEQLYHLLAPREQRHFERWLIAELNGGRQDLLKMFQCRTATKKPKSWKQIQEELGLSDASARARLDHLRNDLTERLEQFLAILALKKDPMLRDCLTLREVQHRKAKHPFRLLFKKLHARLTRQPTKDRIYYERLYTHHSLQQAHIVDFPTKLRKGESLLNNRIEAASQVAKLRLMRLSINALIESTIEEKTDLPASLIHAKTWLFPSTRENFDGQYESDLERIFDTFFQAYTQMIWNQDQPLDLEKELFRQLKRIQDQISSAHRMDFIAFLFNLLVRRTKSASATWQKEAFLLLLELDEWRIGLGILQISRQSIRNTINILLRCADLSPTEVEKKEIYHQAESYLAEQIRFLPEEEQASVLRFNQAHIHFAKGEYDQVLFSQTGDDLSDPYYTIAYQMLACQAKYELREHEELIAAVDALSNRIRKTPLLQEIDKKPYLKQSTLFSKILRAKTADKFQQLQDEINDSRRLYGRDWLLKIIKERLEELS